MSPHDRLTHQERAVHLALITQVLNHKPVMVGFHAWVLQSCDSSTHCLYQICMEGHRYWLVMEQTSMRRAAPRHQQQYYCWSDQQCPAHQASTISKPDSCSTAQIQNVKDRRLTGHCHSRVAANPGGALEELDAGLRCYCRHLEWLVVTSCQHQRGHGMTGTQSAHESCQAHTWLVKSVSCSTPNASCHAR